jgi:glycosyltransferase involved in cell wall biosynthesis
MKPLISVVMPVFNAANTVLLALASLQAQTYQEWECIVVNDGSTDDSARTIRAVRDSRIQNYRLDRNRGRGYARQYGLDLARGAYITFLDADDWIYPNKFSVQAELLEGERGLAIVSTGMAITNARDQMVGIRGSDHDAPVMRASLKGLRMPPLAFAPSMIVAEVAKKTGFDPSFPISEDVDFLLRGLYGKRYAVLPDPLYVYREHGSATITKVSSALSHCCRMFGKQLHRHPLKGRIEIAKARGKQLAYHAASTFGLWDYMIERRSHIPSTSDLQQYDNAWRIVSEIAAAHSTDHSICPT